MTASIVRTCWGLFRLDVDPATVVLDIVDADTDMPSIVGSVSVEGVGIAAERFAAELWPLPACGANLGSVHVVVHCPDCEADMVSGRGVKTLAQLGELLGEVGCAECGWMPV